MTVTASPSQFQTDEWLFVFSKRFLFSAMADVQYPKMLLKWLPFHVATANSCQRAIWNNFLKLLSNSGSKEDGIIGVYEYLACQMFKVKAISVSNWGIFSTRHWWRKLAGLFKSAVTCRDTFILFSVVIGHDRLQPEQLILIHLSCWICTERLFCFSLLLLKYWRAKCIYFRKCFVT